MWFINLVYNCWRFVEDCPPKPIYVEMTAIHGFSPKEYGLKNARGSFTPRFLSHSGTKAILNEYLGTAYVVTVVCGLDVWSYTNVFLRNCVWKSGVFCQAMERRGSIYSHILQAYNHMSRLNRGNLKNGNLVAQHEFGQFHCRQTLAYFLKKHIFMNNSIHFLNYFFLL